MTVANNHKWLPTSESIIVVHIFNLDTGKTSCNSDCIKAIINRDIIETTTVKRLQQMKAELLAMFAYKDKV